MSGKSVNVLLTGAAGTIGSEVLKQAAADSRVNLTVFDIRTKASEKLFRKFSDKVRIIYGDITNPEQVNNAAANQDVVIHLAAVIPPLADENPELAERVNTGGTVNILRALSKHAPGAFLMYSSSVSVYGDRVTNPEIRTGDALNLSAGDWYAVTKLNSEQAIQDSGVQHTIFRLSAIMKSHKISKLMFHMPLETTLEISTPEDVARALINGIFIRKKLNGRILNIGGGRACTTSYENFLQQNFKLFGLGKLNFKPGSFAEKNFHCGFYADGDEAEALLKFRRDTLESYYEKTRKGINPIVKTLACLFRIPIKKYLQSQSEPLKALKTQDSEMINHFFG